MLNQKISFIILGIFVLNTSVYSQNSPQEADFDTNFLMGNTKKNIDISRFKYTNPILPGIYNLDVYVNNKWIGKQNFDFTSTIKQSNATTCFTLNTLLNYHVKYAALEHLINDKKSHQCAALSEWIPNAYYDFDTSIQRLDIFIPQIAMQTKARDYVDPNTWDHGINAGFLSYNANAYQIKNNLTQQSQNTNAFISLSAGLNFDEWQLRHNGQWQWSNNKNTLYTPINTYLQRAIPKYQSIITLGDSFTSGNLFNSIGYRGLDFSSDERMLPNSMLGYAPQIHGVARTNAKVEIRQRGQLIYQTIVSPGAFEINDLYPTGFGGTLDVSILESDGYTQRFSVPYSASVQMLRPKRKKFSFTIGQIREKSLNTQPVFSQGLLQYGLNNYLTTSGGLQISKKFYAINLGTALSTKLGAFSVDLTHNSNELVNKSISGELLNITYNRLMEPTNTQLSLSASQQLHGNYFTLKDAISFKDYAQFFIEQNPNTLGSQRNQFQININQILPQQFGSFYLTGLWTNYSGSRQSNKEYQFGYNNSYKGINYALSVTSQQLQYANQKLGHNTEYLLTFAFPISFNRYTVNTNASFSEGSQTLGLNGNINDRLNYSATLAKLFNQKSYTVTGNYKSDLTTIGSSYTQSDSYKQAMLGLSGNVVVHPHGILFSPEQGQTMGIVYAPDATGAKINSNPNILVNKSGYALIPYLNPYRLNDIYIDPENTSNNVELKETSYRIAPYAGSITKIIFSTQKGYAIYIHSKMPNGQPLPFAAQAYNTKGEVVGMVAQGSLIYIRTPLPEDTIKIKWGEKETDQCNVHYTLKHQLENSHLNMFMVESPCQ